MSRKFPLQSSLQTCDHLVLTSQPSEHAAEAGYKRLTAQQRATAAGKNKAWMVDDAIFPGPLVLPGDELSLDPKCPIQSVRSWQRDPDRNEVTPDRRTIYVVGSPQKAPDVAFMHNWSTPHTEGQASGPLSASTQPPKPEDVATYLGAFYTGLPVKLFPKTALRFTKWDDSRSEKFQRLLLRPQPQQPLSLNLNDLLDVTVDILPEDAYALILLSEHDLYEADDDEFCCGRAYGGSRVAVVSSARYNPALDEIQGVEREHAWPWSYCSKFVDRKCLEASGPEQCQPPKKKRKKPASSSFVEIIDLTEPVKGDPYAQSWLSRLGLTASHELGHCFGIDHCVAYACVMQGTSSIAEDARQPPYMCPIDLTKLLRATGAEEKERYRALRKVCADLGNGFAAFETWLIKRLVEDVV